jgi:DNA-directed RNA polymerase specialized sigma subunit
MGIAIPALKTANKMQTAAGVSKSIQRAHEEAFVRQIEDAIWATEQRLCRTATAEQIAGQLRLSLPAYQRRIIRLRSLSQHALAINPETEIRLNDWIDSDEAQLKYGVSSKQIVQLFVEAIDRMPLEEKTVFALYYREQLTGREIAAALILEPEWVYFCLVHAVLRLRSYVAHNWPAESRD